MAHGGDQGSRRQEPLLVFLHIPKTAGTTLRTVLNMNEPGARSRALGNVFKGGGGTNTRPIERFRAGQAPDLGDVRLVRGHVPLGVCDHLPKGRELAVFTFLRDPADRTLSHFYAVREHGREYGLSPLPKEATLADALELGYIHDNLQTRMLSGLLEPLGEVTEGMLEQAKRNLRDRLVFFGLTERFDESLALARHRLGFRTILYRTSGRVNTARPRGSEVPTELVRAAERCNRYDIELYRYAAELFESAPERGRLDYEVELAALRAARAESGQEPEPPVPAGFSGDSDAWRMLLAARTEVLRLEWERTRHRVPHVAPTLRQDALEADLKATRSRARKLEGEVERLEDARAKSKRLQQEVERRRADSERAKGLDRELAEQAGLLRAATARSKDLEREVERLEALASRTRKLEQQVDRLADVRSRNKELQAEVERLREAGSRTAELEQEVERLRAASTRRTKELERKVERLRAARSRKTKLEQKVERLRAAAEVGPARPEPDAPQK